MSVETVFENERTVFAHDDELFLCAWRDAPRMEDMRALRDLGRRIEPRGGSLALLNVALDGVPRFGDDVRAAAAEYTRDSNLFARGRAHVVVMTGLAGVAVLAFINTFLLLGRPPVPTKAFRALDGGIRFLLPLLPASWSAPRVMTAFGLVESRLRSARQG